MPAQTIQTMPREEFIEKNLGLVHACAGRFKSRGIEYEELYAAGCLGLVKAVDGFDTRGVCFSTYAVPVILGEIKKLFRDGGTVKVSRSLKELGLKVNAERERCLKHTGQEPGVAQLAEILQTTPEQTACNISDIFDTVAEILVDKCGKNRKAGIVAMTANLCCPAHGFTSLYKDNGPPEETLADRIGLREVMDKLEPKDRELIRLRFFGNRTQTETARILGSTQVQISRRERKILAWMRVQLLEI